MITMIRSQYLQLVILQTVMSKWPVIIVLYCVTHRVFAILVTVTYNTLATHLISTISSNYTSHHGFSVLQPSNYSKYHICLQILVGAPSATALLQHGIPFLPPSKIVRPYITHSVWPPDDLRKTSDSCLMCDYARVINFVLLLLLLYCLTTFIKYLPKLVIGRS